MLTEGDVPSECVADPVQLASRVSILKSGSIRERQELPSVATLNAKYLSTVCRADRYSWEFNVSRFICALRSRSAFQFSGRTIRFMARKSSGSFT